MQPIRKEFHCDLAIIGGGVGGCAAAVAAARRGLRVMLFERGVSLGGIATNGYVPQVAGNIEGICLEFCQKLDEIGELRQWNDADYYRNPSFEPEYGKFVLENMVTSAGARVIYDATCFDVQTDGAVIEKCLFHTKQGVIAVSAKIFIDATGDADVAEMAGVPYEVGGVDFAGLNMSTTLGSRWAGANLVKYEEAEKKFREEQLAEGKEPLSLIYVKEEEWIQAGKLVRHVANRHSGFFRVLIPNCPMDNAEFVTFAFHSYFCQNTDAENISRQVLEQHQLMQGFRNFLRECIPGFENIRIVGTGSLPGVRDSRRIFGEYMLKAADVCCGTKFEDGIARFPEVLDCHHPTSGKLMFQRHYHMRKPEGSAVTLQGGCIAEMHPFGEPEGVEVRPNPRDYCDIPYRSLLPEKIDNLLAVGRCCSAEFHANGAMRIIGPAMGTGHAAAVAASMAIAAGVRPRDLDGREVRRVLIEEEGVPLDKPCDGHWKYLRETEGEIFISKGGDFAAIKGARMF
ncbi:MAG: FAD-dependent oxidoreductase [Oscillospiraceae bacterium]|nr:FAD-dependent oxidoreductase [Oscillospiraceae bacterium]